MKIDRYLLDAERLKPKPVPEGRQPPLTAESAETWWDVQDAGPEELRRFLAPLDLHPLQLKRCLDSFNSPGVVSLGKSLLLEYPAALGGESTRPAYLTILLQGPLLITLRHGAMPSLDDLIRDLTSETAPAVLHLPQILYLILDQFTDLNVDAQISIRDRIQLLSNTFVEKSGSVSLKDLSRLQAQVETLVSLVENQLYSISALNACDHEALKDPHRKAYVQDLLSETEIAQRGVYRLEARVKDLYDNFQAAGNERVEKRLRLLTIVSAITLPLGLIAGLLGMNVGGLPGTTNRSAFLVVIGLMMVIAAAGYVYFRRKKWFD
jgi:magnesium transporter